VGENCDCDDGRVGQFGFDDDWPLDDAIEDDIDEEEDETR
jgi:hypothetical protein